MQSVLEFAARHPLLAAAAVAMTVLVIFTEARLRLRRYGEATPAEAVRLINQGALVLDTRNRQQYEQGHIIDARHLTPEALEDGLVGLAKDKSRTLITYCESGMAAGRVAAQLARAGYTQVHNLRGGLAAWRQDNLPLVSKKDEPRKAGKGAR